MRNKEKGFTIVELLVVISIMAVLLILVFPMVSRVIKKNETKEYEYYEKTLVEVAKLYYDQANQGGWTGCLEMSYQQLMDSKLLKAFHDENINCNYNNQSKVRITKNKDKEEYHAYVSCFDTKKQKIVYETENIPTAPCEKVVETNVKFIYDVALRSSNLNEKCSINPYENQEYLFGECTYNYLSYGGYVFRIYGRNIADKTVYLIMNQANSYSYFGGNSWGESNIREELENFYYSLPDSRDTLFQSTCLYDDINFCNQYGSDYVGLMKKSVTIPSGNIYSPFLLTGGDSGYLNIGEPYWLFRSEGDLYPDGSVYDPSMATTYILGVRPTLVLKGDVPIVSGNGTETYPYRIEK